MGKLLFLFIVVPLIDLVVLTHIGGMIGLPAAVGIVIVTGMLGAWLFKLEGRRAWRSFQRALAEGRMPEDGVMSGLLLVIGGALLVAPGLITDAIGLTLIIPYSRRFFAGLLGPYLLKRLQARAGAAGDGGPTVRVVSFDSWSAGPPPDSARPDVSSSEPPQIEEAVVVGRRVSAKRPAARPVIDADFEVESS